MRRWKRRDIIDKRVTTKMAVRLNWIVTISLNAGICTFCRHLQEDTRWELLLLHAFNWAQQLHTPHKKVTRNFSQLDIQIFRWSSWCRSWLKAIKAHLFLHVFVYLHNCHIPSKASIWSQSQSNCTTTMTLMSHVMKFRDARLIVDRIWIARVSLWHCPIQEIQFTADYRTG